MTKTDNLKLWNAVATTDKKYLKPVSFGARKFTAIDPQYQIKEVTKAFGPVGHGWGCCLLYTSPSPRD